MQTAVEWLYNKRENFLVKQKQFKHGQERVQDPNGIKDIFSFIKTGIANAWRFNGRKLMVFFYVQQTAIQCLKDEKKVNYEELFLRKAN
ncbi:hypothetical protein Glove_360g79 [Diversispora epigaea]|uniref:Uncharacterized protein n=1 Tax=Diversispora epigaea TaxID=1348612 RepID=A0A397HE66_9GLOM|nr:hypothetical protein Glove_360g79 [Diversispora epigaea]